MTMYSCGYIHDVVRLRPRLDCFLEYFAVLDPATAKYVVHKIAVTNDDVTIAVSGMVPYVA